MKLLFSRKTLFFLGLFFFFLLFRFPLEDLFIKIFVKNWLGRIETSWSNDLIFISIFGLSMSYFFIRLKDYFISKIQIAYSVLLGLICLSYRVNSVHYSFVSFHFFPDFFYVDIVFPILILYLIFFLKRFNKNHKRNIEPPVFFDDSPINIESDLLGYHSYAQLLGQRIKNSSFNGAFSIGINGQWGKGKTSFLNLIKNDLKLEEIILVDFNPWKANSKDGIVKYFFSVLKSSLGKYHSIIDSQFQKYSDSLLANSKNDYVKTVTDILLNVQNDSTDSLFSDINKSLVDIDRKVIVFIDDLDRSDKEEIVEVIRLIRNTANFTNIYFIVAYDVNYLIAALADHNPYNHNRFLEKIFQLEISLPLFKKEILINDLYDKLKSNLPEHFSNDIKMAIYGDRFTTSSSLFQNIETMRDVTRLANSFCFNIWLLKGNVDFGDLLKLELLRIKYYNVYILFKNTKYDFLELKNQDRIESKYHLKGPNNKPVIEEYLSKNLDILLIKNEEIPLIMNLINDLFSLNRFTQSLLTVNYESKFNRYFVYNLYDENLSEADFNESWKLTLNELKLKIVEWVKKGKKFDINLRLEQIKEVNTKEEFEKLILIIFYFANLKSPSKNLNYNNLIGFDSRNLYNKIADFNKNRIPKFYTDGKAGYKAFLLEIFKSAPFPYYFESDLIRFINKEHEVHIPFTKAELQLIAIQYLDDACKRQEKLSSDIWRLYHDTVITEWIPTGSGSYSSSEVPSEAAITILIEFLLHKDLKGFMETLIEQEPFEEGKYSISSSGKTFFFTWDKFITAIKNVNNAENFAKEFIQFYEEFAKTDYKKYIPFTFKYLMPRNRRN